MSQRLLVIEDNLELVANLFAFLEARGYALDASRDGISGLHRALEIEYDAIILDWMLPRMSGSELLRQLRDKGFAGPVLMLTARDELVHKLEGFKAGADDYLTKPFEFAELEARLNALIARRKGRSRVLQIGDLRFDLSTQSIMRASDVISLHTACRKILETLMRESPSVVSRERLESVVWGDDLPDTDILRSHIYELRKRIDGPYSVKLVHTLPKHGYRVALPELQS